MRLTDKQKQVYLYIKRRIYAGHSPTLTELSREFGSSFRTGAYCHLVSLRNKGLITWDFGRDRTIRLLQEPLVFGLDNEIYSFSDLFQEGNVLTREGEVKRNGVVIATVMKVGHP